MERINGETISGAALTILGILFLLAAELNATWVPAIPAASIIVAVGVALIVLGRYTTMKTNRLHSHTEERSNH